MSPACSRRSRFRTPARRLNAWPSAAMSPEQNGSSRGGLPTAPFVRINRGEPIPQGIELTDWLAEGPLFVKPASEDAGTGIDHDSVVSDWSAPARHPNRGNHRPLRRRGSSSRHIRRPGVRHRRVVAIAGSASAAAGGNRFSRRPRSNCAGRSSRIKANGTWKASRTWQRNLAAPPTSSRPSLPRLVKSPPSPFAFWAAATTPASTCASTAQPGQMLILEVNANPDAGPRARIGERFTHLGGIEYNEFVQRLVATTVRRGDRNGSSPPD